MERATATYSGPSLDAAIQRAAAQLSVPSSDIEHEILLGSDAEGHVLIRARARAGASPVALFLGKLLEALGSPSEVKASHVGDLLQLDVVAPEAAATLGDPEVSEALSHLVRRAAEKLEPGSRVQLHVLGEPEDRDAFLVRLAGVAVDRCRRYGRPVALPPMNPYERRLLHLTVRETTELSTESVGAGRDRHIVVLPFDTESSASVEDSEPR